jgi:putative Mn2+ efflux pump MntP
MEIIQILIIAVALAMDAFAVSITLGIRNGCNRSVPLALKAATTFSLFQIVMPLIGFFIGDALKGYFASYTGIIAFILLTLIGINMIREWYFGNIIDENGNKREFSSWANILILGVATSIDALSVGFSLSLIDFSIFTSAAIIGVVTFILSFIGVDFGSRLGCRFTKAELIGGIVLILIGIKILVM